MFDTVGIPLQRGRDFNDDDTGNVGDSAVVTKPW